MRNNWIWIIVIFVIVMTAGYWYKNKQKKQDFTEPEPQQIKPVRTQSRYDPSVAALQRHINEELPPDYPKLVVDGILGPKTLAAQKYLEEHSQGQKTEKIKEITEDLLFLNPVTAPIAVSKKVNEAWSWVKKQLS